uniref:Uncharacterized protein n=1 Tax=Plectus sambesii TaxID=2011161 RepID=A0A914WFM2_9BILA
MNQTALAALILLVAVQLAQPYVLEPKRASELFGKRASELFGKRASELFGKRASELFGKRASELFGKRSAQPAFISILADRPYAEMIAKRSVYDDDYASAGMTPDMIDEVMDRFETQRGRRASELFGR